jgi:hypothetical protein
MPSSFAWSAYYMLLRAVACFSLGLAKSLPIAQQLAAKMPVFRIDRPPLKLAAFFDLFFEEYFFVERHGCT